MATSLRTVTAGVVKVIGTEVCSAGASRPFRLPSAMVLPSLCTRQVAVHSLASRSSLISSAVLRTSAPATA